MAESTLARGGIPAGKRAAARRSVAIPARLTWKDASGAVRFASVVTRDVSDVGVFVECETAMAIPLFRLVHLQIEKHARTGGLPARLMEGRVLSAVWRVGPRGAHTGTPSGYALRFLLDPQAQRAAAGQQSDPIAVAS